MKIEVDAPEPHQVLVVASNGTRWAAQVIDRAHVGGSDWGPFTAALRYADAHLAVRESLPDITDVPEHPAARLARLGDSWAQDASDGTPTIRAGGAITISSLLD
jgi:hypothetical protein